MFSDLNEVQNYGNVVNVPSFDPLFCEILPIIWVGLPIIRVTAS
jgi:hypothetical protein